jgi:hypothetical protein
VNARPSDPALPKKRRAYEPAAKLVAPVAHDPRMPRPTSTVAGGVIVLLRAAAGFVWIAAFSFGWGDWVQNLATALTGDASEATSDTPTDSPAILALVIGIVGTGAVIEAALGVLILFGINWVRVLVMVFSVLSISSSFVGWWVQGQEIRINTTFVTLSLDILILLALSSRSSAAYARRRQKPRE